MGGASVIVKLEAKLRGNAKREQPLGNYGDFLGNYGDFLDSVRTLCMNVLYAACVITGLWMLYLLWRYKIQAQVLSCAL